MSQNATDRQLVALVLVILGAILLLPMLLMGGMMGFGSMMGGMWGTGQAPSWMGLIGLVMQLAFLAVIVVAGYLVYGVLAGSDSETEQALEELRLAYARGDLTDDEYEQRRETLKRDT